MYNRIVLEINLWKY